MEITLEAIEKKLSAKWVKDDSFVPIKTIPRVEEIELMSISPDEEILKENERHEKLLEIPGVMISDVEVREYPLGEAAAHLVGYVQSVTAEDLEEHAGEGYTANSVIGRSGMEGLFESELKGQNGCRIYIVNSEGKEKEELACILVQHGEDIQLTIDANLQISFYEQFKEDKSCSVAMNPYIGEVLALVSTPAYDNNDFIMGLSSEQWTVLNEDENKPMYNRFRQVLCPGSTFKPITAAVGLESGAIDPMEDYGNVGLSWQKDASWGSYHVTTLHAYEPVILENALIYSDNIYFAKAALKIGSEEMESSLTGLGFNEELPFEIKMAESQYSNSEGIETEIQLADSGYGQGQVLVNPLHMQNHEAVETFYADYLDGRDSMVTVFEVHRDGLIGAVTFIYRKGELQTYYIGVRWKEGGVPEIQGTSVSNVAEIKLTEKGYFIYAYEYVIAHASLRQYWRIEPLPEDCQELTEKYISGLSYVNYNVLVTNWNSSNVKDILMPCMYEDIYRISTGENLKTEDWKIPAEEYERIMTTYFPVSIEQLREYCGYDEGSNSYEYEMIYASPYPPFGEVVDYTKNADGTITLIVDGVWPDYNSDLAFRNTVVVQPFEDGTFRYLSNSIEQIELELPPIARTKG